MPTEKIPFKIWNSTREERRLVLALPVLKNVIEGANKKGITGEVLVLEEDESIVDEDELLIHFKNKTFILLEKELKIDENPTSDDIKIIYQPSEPSPSTSLETLQDSQLHVLDFGVNSPSSIETLTTLSMSSRALPENDNNDVIAKRESHKIFEDFEIPWHKFPQAALDLCQKNEKLGPHLKTVLQIIVDALRVKSKYIAIDIFRDVATKLCNAYPLTFAYKDMEGNFISPRNSPLVTSLIQRNNYLNRSPQSNNNKSALPLKMRKFSKNFETTCKNWQPSEDTESSESIQAKKSQLLKLSKQANFTKEENAEIEYLMHQCYLEQRKFFNNLLEKPSFSDIQEHWPFLLKKEILFKHFENLTGKDLSKIKAQFSSKIQKIIKFAEDKHSKIMSKIYKEHANRNLVALKFLADYFQEEVEFICKIYPIGSQLADIEIPTARPWFAAFETGSGHDTVYVFIKKNVANSTSQSFEEALIQIFCFYFTINDLYPREASQTFDFIQRYFFGIHTDSTRGEKKNINAISKVLRLISLISQQK